MHITRDFLTCYSCSYYSSMLKVKHVCTHQRPILLFIWLVNISVIVSSDELSRSFMLWLFRGKVKTFFLETFYYYGTIQNYKKLAYVIFKLLLDTNALSKSYMVMKYFIKLVSHWALCFCDRNWKYRHDNLQAIFHIFWLISNCL